MPAHSRETIHENFMQHALNLAVQSVKEGTGPFGCVIVKEGDVLSEGWNQVTELNDPTAHAEIQAIRKACKKLKTFQLTGCNIYTSCFPCPQCLGAIYWARPEEVYYTNTTEEAARIGFDDVRIYKEICGTPEERTFQLKKVELPHALAAFEAWEENSNTVQY